MPEYPTNENERIPESYFGSFSYLPPEAFANNMVKRTVKRPWDERYQAIKDILGYATFEDGGITRYLPWNDYDDPLYIACRCEITGKSYDGQNSDLTGPPMQTGNRYAFALIDVYFAAPKFRLGEREESLSQVGPPASVTASGCEQVRFCTKEIKPGVELVTAKLPSFKFGDGAGEQILYPLPLTLPYEDTIVRWYAVPLSAVPFTAIRDCVAKTNSGTVSLPDIPGPATYESQTLVLYTYQLSDVWLPAGGGDPDDDEPVRAVNVTYFFKYRAKDALGKGGWNYRPDSAGDLRPVVRIADTAKGPLLESDFSKLFKPEP